VKRVLEKLSIMCEQKKMLSEKSLEQSTRNSLQKKQRINQKRLGKRCSSLPFLSLELAEHKAKSDRETDDLSIFLNPLFLKEEKQIPESLIITESPPIPLPNGPRYTHQINEQRWASAADLLPELADFENESDSDTDDSSKVLNRLFIENNRWSQDPTPSVESEDPVHYIVTLAYPESINSTGSQENEKKFDPVYKLEVARSLFEEHLAQRESQLLKTPESRRFLKILRDTILSPVSTLLVKLHAPSEWRTCMSCEGFLQTHCCLKSQYFWGYKGEHEPVICNNRHLHPLQTYTPIRYSG